MSKEDAIDVSDAEPINWPEAEDTAPVNEPDDDPIEDEAPPAKDGAKDKWDPNRQKLDETAAQARKNADALGDIRSTVESLPNKLRDMVAEIVAEKGVGQEPAAENADDLLDQIDNLDTDADFDSVVDGLKALAKKMRNGNGDKGEIAKIEQAMKDLRDKDAARDSREANNAAQTRVKDHLSDLEREHFDGKRTYRADILKDAKAICAKMGFTGDRLPPESTGLLALDAAAQRIAAKQQAAKKVKDTAVVTDSMASGRPADFGEKHLSMEEAVKEMGL